MNRSVVCSFVVATGLAACIPQIVDKQGCEAPGDCLDGYVCVERTCVATPVCVPKTCETAQAECGEVSDGCGANVDCGDTCAAPLRCGGGGTPNQCGYVADGWSVETVEEKCNECGKPDLAIDGSGRAYVSFFGRINGDYGVWLYRQDSAGWKSDLLSSVPFDVGPATCAKESSGEPYVAVGTQGGFLFEYRSADGWQSAGVGSGSMTTMATDLLFDDDESPHVCAALHSMLGEPEAELRYATYREGAGWSSEVVPLGDSVMPLGCRIAVDSAHRVHVVLGDSTSKGLLYAVKEDGSWTVGPILPGEASHEYFSMALGNLETPVIAFHDPADSTARVATLRDGAWSSEIVDTVASYAAYTSIAVDSAGIVHLSYYQPKEAGYLKYATDAAGSWTTQSIAVGGSLVIDAWGNGTDWSPRGGYSSLALDPADKPRIVFYDAANGQMRFAKKL